MLSHMRAIIRYSKVYRRSTKVKDDFDCSPIHEKRAANSEEIAHREASSPVNLSHKKGPQKRRF